MDTNIQELEKDRFPLSYLLIFIFITIIIAISGYLLYEQRKAIIEDEMYRHISAIKDLKLQQIDNEQEQRKNIVDQFIETPAFKQDLSNLFTNKNLKTTKSNVERNFKNIITNFNFLSVNAFDLTGNLILSSDSTNSIADNFLKEEVAVILSRDSSSNTNLYIRDNKYLIQAVITPFKEKNKIIGYLWSEVTFFQYLYPIITYSKQEPGDVEYLIVKKESDLAFLLRDVQEDEKYFIRTVPLSTEDKNQVKELLQKESLNADIQYRGAKSLAAFKQISDTDWYLIAKINEASISESLKNTAVLIFSVAILLAVLSASITYSIWKRSRLHFLTRTIKLKEEKEALSERYTSLTRYANDIILSVDRNGKILEANQQAVFAYGYFDNSLIGMDFFELSLDAERDKRMIEAQENSSDGILFETNHKRRDGSSFPVEISAKYISSSGERILLSIIRDNTERKKLELDLIAAKDKAEEMDRLKTVFLSNMSHELRTPMSGILGYSEILQSELDNDKYREMAKMIYKSSSRLNETLNSLLDLSKIESNELKLEFETIELNTLVRECSNLFIKTADSKGLKINFNFYGERIVLKSDMGALYKIFNNVIDNAIKYTKEGEIKISTNSDNERASVIVSDTGIGIPEKYLQVIFEPFRQGSEGFNRDFEGTGLGLTITKKFVELLGGRLTVESKMGEGTTLTILLPINHSV